MSDLYLRVIPKQITQVQKNVFDFGENALVYHMTNTKLTLSFKQIYLDCCQYTFDWNGPYDFNGENPFSYNSVKKSLNDLVECGLIIKNPHMQNII